MVKKYIIHKMSNILKKIKVSHFFKTKKFFILVSLFVLFFLFTPISLHQISNRIEDFIDNKAKGGVEAFEEQTGLKIKWELLDFNILTMTVKLEGVQVIPLNTSNFQKIQELHFLDGLQKIGKISARPSLYSLLFEKKIILSKLNIQKGEIYLKTLKSSLRRKKEPQGIDLPIKKLLIKNTHLNLSHKDHRLQFSNLKSTVLQKNAGIFHFNFFVEAFRINKNEGFKEFQGLRSHLPEHNNWNEENKHTAYQLSFKGVATKGKVSFKEIHLRNEKFQSLTEWLDIYFDSKGLKQLRTRSSGSLPFFLIHQGMDLLGQQLFFFDTFLSYKLNIQYRKNKGYQGFFDIQGEDAVFKSSHLKSFSLRGRLINYLLAIDKGTIEIQEQGSINIKKGEWIFKGEPLQFNFSVETVKLSSDFVTQILLNLDEFPVQGDLTGLTHCHGAVDSYLKCSIQSQSDRIKVQAEDQEEIMSIYGMNWNLDMEWSNQMLNFSVSGEKNDLSEIYFKGRYSQPLNQLKASYSFFGRLDKDLKFNTPFPMEGRVGIQEGELAVEKDKIQLNGSLKSSLLKIQSYKLRNISSLYKLENSRLDFFEIRGSPGRTNYTAECNIDFEKEQLVLNLTSPFLDMENLLEAVQTNDFYLGQFKGTGTVSFFMNFPWSSPEKKEFQLKGDFFNVSIDKDFFQQVTLDFGLKNNKGVVRSLFFKKGQGFIKSSGVFDHSYLLNLDVVGQNLSLERLEWLNQKLPFNQSGDVNFNMKIKGPLNDPQIVSDVSVSNMFIYSYPVDNSSIQLEINKNALSFSGRIMDEINIDQFIYPFSNKSKIEITGQFTGLDFIKILFSKNRIEKAQDYFSQTTGSFSISKNRKTQKPWIGRANIDQLFVSKSNQWIKSEEPFSVFFGEKKWSLTPTRFSGYGNKNLIIEKRENDKLFLSGESSLGLFSVFFPFMEKFEGNVKGQLLMDNNLQKIHPRGSLQIERGLFAVNALPDFTDINTSLIFSKNNVFINNFNSNVGGGLVKGEGSIFYDFNNVPRLNLNLNFFNSHLNIPEDFSTKGSGKLQIKGNSPPYLISGWYAIDSGVITKDFSGGSKKTKYDFSFLNKEIEKKESLFELQLNVKTKQAVDIHSSLIQSSIEGQADIYGPLDSLLINGRFALSQKAEENLIFFRGQEFKISSGSILFQNSAPDSPLLNIKADTLFTEQIIDPLESHQEIEKKYKIFLSLKGPSQDPDFSLKSSPALNEKEIISLLTLGVGSRRFDANVTQNVTDYSYQILASLLLEKSLNKEIKDTLGVDFRLTPYINTLNKPVTKITLSKNWFEKWRTSFSRTIEDAQSDIKLKYDLNQKISLTAFWENTGPAELENNQDDRLGLDFEFNFDF